MKNKIVLITIISILIVIICLIVLFVIKNNNKYNDSSNNENYLSIQSTKEHKITKNGIEAENTHGTPIEPFPTRSTHNHKKG